MARIIADRVRDTTTTTGTGAVTVSGTAPQTYRTFSAVCTTGDTLPYFIQHQAADEWEVGIGTYSAANQLTRTTVLSSSNSGNAVNLSAGTKEVVLGNNAERTYMEGTQGGRLTLTSVTPVLGANTTAASTVYYTPYVHPTVWVYNGALFIPHRISELSLALDSNSGHTGYQQSGKLFDFFITDNAGTITLGTGPAWSSTSARGTGAGTTELQRVNGIWTNKVSMTLRIGSLVGDTITVAANQGTYVGTMYATANGQTGMNFNPTAAAGGTANILGLFNAYNRTVAPALCRDSTSSWTYATNTWQKANNNANNSISYVDGLAEVSAYATYTVMVLTTASSSGLVVGINLNSTTAAPAVQGGVFHSGTQAGEASAVCSGTFLPVLGYNTLTAMEIVGSGVGTQTLFGSGFDTNIASTQGLIANVWI